MGKPAEGVLVEDPLLEQQIKEYGLEDRYQSGAEERSPQGLPCRCQALRQGKGCRGRVDSLRKPDIQTQNNTDETDRDGDRQKQSEIHDQSQYPQSC
jgi:hypothetical protein